MVPYDKNLNPGIRTRKLDFFMPRSAIAAALAGALLLTACSSGISYDPNKGLVMNKAQNASSDSGQDAAPATTDDGAPSAGLTLGKLFGPPAKPYKGGFAVGDEPYAVKAGANILAQGGSAADAATAMYMTMAVTYPGAAGLGGGGLCVAYDPDTNKAEAIDFLARNAAGGGDYAVPGNVRGFAALQGQFGKLPWQRDVAYAEALAATGFPISDALAARLKAAQNVVRLDAGLAAEFLDESGQVKAAGTIVSNPALAETLGAIRQHGADALYSGSIADKILAYSRAEGGALGAADLTQYTAHLRAPQTMKLQSKRIYLPPQSVGAGSFAAAVMARLVAPDGTITAGTPTDMATRQAVLATLRKFGVQGLPSDLGATGFAAMDKNGEAVACAVTMNGPFGSGHTAAGTGVTLAKAPAHGRHGLAAAFLTPMLVAQNITGPIRLPDEAPTYAVMLAGAGAGGPNGTEAIATAALRLARGETVTKPGNLRMNASTPYDTVNAIVCQNNICAVLPDTRAHGLGAAAQGGN